MILDVAGGDLEALLFKRLEGVRKRPTMPFKPGPLLIAAYGDNWCNLLRAQLPLCATLNTQTFFSKPPLIAVGFQVVQSADVCTILNSALCKLAKYDMHY